MSTRIRCPQCSSWNTWTNLKGETFCATCETKTEATR